MKALKKSCAQQYIEKQTNFSTFVTLDHCRNFKYFISVATVGLVCNLGMTKWYEKVLSYSENILDHFKGPSPGNPRCAPTSFILFWTPYFYKSWFLCQLHFILEYQELSIQKLLCTGCFLLCRMKILLFINCKIWG